MSQLIFTLEPIERDDRPIPAYLEAMPLVDRLMIIRLQVSKLTALGIVKIRDYIVVQLILIAFERQYIIALARLDLSGIRALTTHRIDRDDTAPNIQQLQKLRNRHDLGPGPIFAYDSYFLDLNESAGTVAGWNAIQAAKPVNSRTPRNAP
jgi:hypothetical protein